MNCKIDDNTSFFYFLYYHVIAQSAPGISLIIMGCCYSQVFRRWFVVLNKFLFLGGGPMDPLGQCFLGWRALSMTRQGIEEEQMKKYYIWYLIQVAGRGADLNLRNWNVNLRRAHETKPVAKSVSEIHHGVNVIMFVLKPENRLVIRL